VLIGIDPWIGSKEDYKLPARPICELHRKGFYTLGHIDGYPREK
jgi:hypothetical protein